MIKTEFWIEKTHRFRLGVELGFNWNRLDINFELSLIWLTIWFSIYRDI